MKKTNRLLSLLILLLAFFVGCIDDSGLVVSGGTDSSKTPVERYGRLQVIGTDLCDEQGKKVQLRGMSTHGLQYYPNFYNEKLVQSLAEEWGADIIRLSSYVNEGTWAQGSPLDVDNDNYYTYLDDPAYWRSYIDQLVDYAGKHGIYALIDWHMLYPGDPLYYLDEAKEFWEYMVNKHGSKKHVLFDICNEPNNKGFYVWRQDSYGEWYKETVVEDKAVTWNGHIKPYAEEIMDIIRAKSQNVAIVGTSNWASRPDLVIGNMLDETNVMYTMHFYAADHGNTHMSYMKKAVNAGVPVFVTEFGTQSASGGEGNDFTSSENWLELLDDENISWCNWNISPDHLSGAVFIKDHYPSSVAGFADTSKMKESGKWIFDKIKNR